MKKNLDSIKQFRTLIETSHTNFKNEELSNLLAIVKEAKQKIIEDRAKLIENFLCLCATNV